MKLPINLLIRKRYIIFFNVVILFLLNTIHAQQLAFPSAVGAASTNVTGGRGGQVIHVTNLNNSGAGSLREALTMSGTRTIVFDVSGVINLTSDIYITNGNFTIAGQTAPEGGITLIGTFSLRIKANNWIMRYIRFRSGYDTTNLDGGWANTTSSPYTRDSTNFIMDHCSGALAKETAGFGGGTSDTVTNPTFTSQYNLVAENDRGTLVGDSGDSDPSTVTVYRNAYINSGWRFPKGGGTISLDVINTYVYNWQQRTIRMDAHDYKLNLISNVYEAGNLTRVTDNDQILFTTYTNNSMNPQIWDEDTLIIPYNFNGGSSTYDPTPNGYPADISNGWDPFYNSVVPISASWFAASRLPVNGDTPDIIPSANVKNHVLENAGANKYIDDNGNVQTYRDTIDTDAIGLAQAAAEGTGKYAESQYESLALALIGTTPSNSRGNDFYQSNPHIPEVWFQANVTAGQDHNDIAPSGYTWLEEYLNQVDYVNSVPTIDVTGVEVIPNTTEIQIPETIDLEVLFTPSDATNQTGVWISSDESIAIVDENGVVTPITEGIVTITFTSNDGGYSVSAVITVLAEALVASAGEDQEICEGETVTLTASGGTSYLWDNGETTTSIDVSPNSTTTYTVTVSNDNGESDQAFVTVTVNSPPVANAGEDQTICEGDSVTLTASGGDSYLWSTGETSATIDVIPSSDTTYSVEVFTGNCSSFDEVTVFVNESPNITSSGDIAIIEGNSTTLGVNGGDNYLWSTGETTPFITVTPIETTTYSVSSTGLNGCTSNLNITVTVVPEVIADAGLDTTICAGETITLTASGGETYIWSTGDTTSSIEVNPFLTTTYTVTVQDAYGHSDSDSVTVTVNDTPEITVSDDAAMLLGETVILTASGGENYLWSTGETTPSIQVSPNQTTTYTVVSTAPGGCADIEQVTVIIIPEVIADAGDDISICNGESITLTASGGEIYLWDTGENTSSITVSPTTTATYNVTVEDAYGYTDTDSVTVTVNELPIVTVNDDITIVEGNSVTLTAEGANTYDWSNGMTGNSITVNPSETTTYIVTGTINGCSSESEVTIIVEDVFVANAGVDEDVCEGYNTNIVLTANNGDSYLWSTGETSQSITVNPVSTTTYSVTITQGIQEDTDEVTVFVNPNPEVVVLNGESVNIMDGDFVTLSASGANTYLWNSGATQPNIAVSPSITTTYEVRGFVGDCYDDKQVTVNVIPEVVADAGEDVEICEGETVQLTASGGDEYVWSTGETSQTIFVSPSETTEYTVTVFNALDFDEDSIIVTVDTDCETEVEDPVIPGETLDFSFDVFPNPASEYVDVKLSGSVELSRIYLYDMTGKLIQYKRISNESLNIMSTTRMDLSGLQPGFYFIKLEDINRELSKRLIIQ